jgi:hypothetical protein
MALLTELLQYRLTGIESYSNPFVKRYLQNTDAAQSPTLNKLGLNTPQLYGEHILEETNKLTEDFAKFDNIFLKEDIIKITNKYQLVLSPSNDYKGDFPMALEQIIKETESLYDIDINQTNCYILQKKTNFDITNISDIDSNFIMFYKIDENHYTLLYNNFYDENYIKHFNSLSYKFYNDGEFANKIGSNMWFGYVGISGLLCFIIPITLVFIIPITAVLLTTIGILQYQNDKYNNKILKIKN